MPRSCSIGGEDRLADRVLGAGELEQRLLRMQRRRVVRQHREQLERGRQSDPGAPDVRHITDAEGSRHVGDLHAFREPARVAGVRLDHVDRAPHQQLAEAEAGELALAAGDRDRLRARTST